MDSRHQLSHDATQILRIGKRSLILAAAILLSLMTATGVLTRFIPSGSYAYETVGGRQTIIEGTFQFTDVPPLPVWRWYTAAIEVLWGPDALLIISIILFMCLIAGAINVMNSGGMLSYLLMIIIKRFADRRYLMEASIILILMLFGSLLGSIEEVVVIVPLMTALAVRMGWDSIIGLGMSLGAIAFGFASALTNPFTIGIAQRLAGIPVFSGIGFRLLIFITIYLVYTWYVITTSRTRTHSLKPPMQGDSSFEISNAFSPGMKRGFRWFVLWLAVMAVMIAASARIEFLSDILLAIVIACFLIGGLGAGACAGMSGASIAKHTLRGITTVAPGIILILMASSIKHIMQASGSMDTLLFLASQRISQAGPFTAALYIYLLVLGLNFFISSGSAKAFLIIPVITPLADMVGLSRQTAVLAYVFGDGFSNIFYPTNAILLICLSITGISYFTWFRWVWKIQLAVFAITLLFLLLAVHIGY